MQVARQATLGPGMAASRCCSADTKLQGGKQASRQVNMQQGLMGLQQQHWIMYIEPHTCSNAIMLPCCSTWSLQ
jgi:hypothetical protein